MTTGFADCPGLVVKGSGELRAKAQLAVDHDGGRITDKAALLSSVIAPNGLVGSVRLNMSTEPIAPDTRWSRRVRARLRRPDQQLVQQERAPGPPLLQLEPCFWVGEWVAG